MTHSTSIQINTRFFSALETLKQLGIISSRKEFCLRYGIDPGNLTRLRREPEREFELAYLSYVVNDYNVSADWLLTGRGKMITG